MNKISKNRTANPVPFQTLGEEIANSILHGLGALLAAAGLTLLVLRANALIGGSGGGSRAVGSYVVFAAAMIAMFLASTLYHAMQHPGAKRILRILDHSAIYFFIAGTYTPLCLIGLRGVWGWTIFGIEWALAAAGITLYAVNCKALKKIELLTHMLMGWVIVIAIFPLTKAIPLYSLIFLGAGGAAYSLGAIWYSLKRLRGAHVAWHVFVLAGAICHWWSIWFMS